MYTINSIFYLAVEQFWKMGCRKVTVFLPKNRQGNKGKPLIPENERELQKKMEDLGIIKVSLILIDFVYHVFLHFYFNLIKYTPGRNIQGKFIQSYDDRFILGTILKITINNRVKSYSCTVHIVQYAEIVLCYELGYNRTQF